MKEAERKAVVGGGETVEKLQARLCRCDVLCAGGMKGALTNHICDQSASVVLVAKG